MAGLVIHVLVAVGLLTSVLQEMWQNISAVLCTCFVRYCLLLKTCTYHWHHVTAWKCQQNSHLKNTEWKQSMELMFLWDAKASHRRWLCCYPHFDAQGCVQKWSRVAVSTFICVVVMNTVFAWLCGQAWLNNPPIFLIIFVQVLFSCL